MLAMTTGSSDDTLPSPTQPSPTPIPDAQRQHLADRYEVAVLLGRGGMGEVWLARDKRIGREVAVKRLRADTANDVLMTRFFREAHVQGILDHPSVVPIHDLGIDTDGRPFIVMKRVTGTTLGQVFAGDPARRPSRAQLLGRLVDVCFAIELAHARGVIHRDLKPGNIMLGDYGETYVLDWGLARLVSTLRASAIDIGDLGVREGETALGELLGTPGYMSPEQARADAIGPPTDVYALGCILFEILVGKPALPHGAAGIAATLAAARHRPSEHATDVPPELDEVCAAATRFDPAARPSARALAERIQAYLEGDRDLARRRELADEHARRARDATPATEAGRATAMQEAGQALILDPMNRTAQTVVIEMLEAPEVMPAEALEAAEADRAMLRQLAARWGARGYTALLAFVAILLLLPLYRTDVVLVTFAFSLGAWGALLWVARRPTPRRATSHVAVFVLTGAMIACSGLLFGPLLITPAFVVAATAGYLWVPHGHRAWLVALAFVLPFLLLVALEALGVTPRTVDFVDGQLVLSSSVIPLGARTTFLVVGIAMTIQVSLTAVIAIAGRRQAERVQNHVHAQRWHLRKMLPQ